MLDDIGEIANLYISKIAWFVSIKFDDGFKVGLGEFDDRESMYLAIYNRALKLYPNLYELPKHSVLELVKNPEYYINNMIKSNKLNWKLEIHRYVKN